MRDHAGLRRAGRPRREDVREEIALTDRCAGIGERARIPLAKPAAASAKLVEVRDRELVLEPQVRDLLALALVLDQHADRVRMLEDVRSVPRRVVRVDRRGNRSDRAQREVEQGPLETRRRENPEGVALADPEREETERELLDLVGRLGPRDLLPAAVPL